jgi:hypothetical protein
MARYCGYQHTVRSLLRRDLFGVTKSKKVCGVPTHLLEHFEEKYGASPLALSIFRISCVTLYGCV